MQFILYTLLCALLLTTTSMAQDAQVNLEKYWRYRERHRNYVLEGDCQGCSLPTGGRASDDKIAWHDQTGEQGYYIATLAMEYRLRLDHGQALNGVDRELYYAIESLNRLDYYAEYWWDYFYNGNTTNPTGSLNGFLIRDDVPADFFNRTVDGNLVENHFNRSLFATSFGYGTHEVTSGFTRGPGLAQCGGHTLGPEEMSQDHYIAILAGLAVVVKLIPANSSYNSTPFMDGNLSYYQEAKNIVYRITMHAKDGNSQYGDWTYTNPITGYPVQGIEWDECIPPGFIDFGVRNVGGASFRLLSYGFAMATSQILNDFDELAADAYYLNNFDGTTGINNSRLLFINTWRNNPVSPSKNEDYKVLLLAGVSSMWDEDTQEILGERFDVEYQNGDEVHVPQAVLLNCILYGNAMTVPNSVWECMLNSAPCNEMILSNENFEWSHGHGRFLYGPNVPHYYYDDEQSGLAYLYFFNIYNLANPAYLGSAYSVLSAVQLLNTDIIIPSSSPFTEYDHKNYFASHEIRTQNLYTITNDNDVYQSYATPLDAANVTFAAGLSIVLNPGFTASNGSIFHAYIDPAFNHISCENQNNSATCTNCKVSGSEENPGVNAGDAHVIVEPIEGELCLVAFEHHIFKVDLNHAQGTTMLGIGEVDDCSNFPCISGCNGDRRYSVIGYQNFNVGSDIVDIVYTGSETYIALTGLSQNHEGRVVKISGTGGSGPQMMGLTEDASGNIQGGNQFLGQQHFLGKDIKRLEYFDNNLLILFKKEMVKIGPTTQMSTASSNMFDVTIDNNGNFVWGSGSSDCGDQQFSGVVTEITELAYINGELLICTKIGAFEHGKILKLMDMGGVGHNMFGVDDNPSNNDFAYENIPGNNHYLGDEFIKSSYQCYVTKITQVGASIICAFRNGRLVKLQGTGGNGHHMFNIEETTGGFDNYSLSSPIYLQGSQDLENFTWVTDVDFINGNTLLTCYNGKMLSIVGAGGTGLNMFNIEANSGYGFNNSNANNTIYMLGCADFHMNMFATSFIDGHILISMYPGVLLNLNGSGTGNNMFGLVYQDENSYKSICGSYFFEGSEDFTDLCEANGNRVLPDEIDSTSTVSDELFIYPNPASRILYVAQAGKSSDATVRVFNSLGQVAITSVLPSGSMPLEIDISELPSGIYSIQSEINGRVLTKSFVVTKN